MKTFALPLVLGICLLAPLASAADIRLKVKNSTLGSKREGDTRKSQRQLKIEIDNRDRDDYEGVTLEWVVIARDIRNRKLSIASRGSKLIDIPAEEEMEIGYNAVYLMEILRKIDGDDVTIDLLNPVTATLLRPAALAEGEDYFCLLMPLRPSG